MLLGLDDGRAAIVHLIRGRRPGPRTEILPTAGEPEAALREREALARND